MTKRYASTALIYVIAAMIFGVFYREFTKFQGFTGKTTLSVMHTHYFLLGMVFFLLLLVLEKSLHLSAQKNMGKVVIAYQIGLNITGLGLFMRGITQALGTVLTRGLDASISGISGIGHIITGVSMILILVKIKKSCS